LERLLGKVIMLFQSDLIGVLCVYTYVIILLLITEKIISKKYPIMSRKILHIMVGNVAFLLPIFETKEIMAFVAAGPFIVFTFLMSSHTPIKSIRGKTSAAGHSMGLVYYSITWTILAYLFFDNMVVIAIGILAMSYGDGFASVIGSKFGLKKYNLFGDEKSYIGSFSMFIFTLLMMIIAILFYGIEISFYLILILCLIALIGAIIEGITPKGLDNLFVPFVVVFLYWYLILL
jgi:dolichol kinase